MKLDVAEETLMGNRIAVSMAGIFRTPLPMPNNAEIRPAPNMIRNSTHRHIQMLRVLGAKALLPA